MPVAAATSVLYGLGKTIGIKPGKLLGGLFGGNDKSDKDETHSKTVQNLTQALLNLNRLDSAAKAQQIAQRAVQMGLDGESFDRVGQYIDSSAGYDPEGPYLPEDGALYPWGQIYKHWINSVSSGKNNSSSLPMGASVGYSGYKPPTGLIIFGVVGTVAALLYWKFQP